MPLTWIIYIAVGLAPFASYGYGVAKTTIDMSQKMRVAIATTKADEQAQCRMRLADVETRINEATAERIRRAAEETPAPAPAASELATLCAKSASCRERTK